MRAPLSLLLHFIWPSACPVCERLGVVACDGCLDGLVRPLLPRCLRCGRGWPCDRHPGAPAHIAGALHEDMARKLVLMIKYGGYRGLAEKMGESLGRRMALPEKSLIVPVPLHIGSSRRYNQSAELARGISRILKEPLSEDLRWRKRVTPQTLGGVKERRSLPRDAMCWRGASLGGREVVLVDDVLTTGTTARTGAEVLKRAGAKRVTVVTWSFSIGGMM